MGRSQERLRDTFVVSEATRRSMQANRSTDTRPELTLRNALWHAGLRGYRKNPKGLPGRPDIVFTKKKLAIFVHGCFWHRCPKCNPSAPKTNALFWSEKFRVNVERDKRNAENLEAAGLTVITVWECEIKEDLTAQVARVSSLLDSLC
jgi:DNA mismatch endonuclease (patch repair protein)